MNQDEIDAEKLYNARQDKRKEAYLEDAYDRKKDDEWLE